MSLRETTLELEVYCVYEPLWMMKTLWDKASP